MRPSVREGVVLALTLWLAACTAFYPPGSPPYRPEPSGPRSIADLLRDPLPVAPEWPPDAACLRLRVTNCYARTVRVAMGPVDLCAETRIAPRPEHVRLVVTWANQDGVVGQSQTPLAGAAEPVWHHTKLSGLLGGDYQVTAHVYSTSHVAPCGMATTTLLIVAPMATDRH